MKNLKVFSIAILVFVLFLAGCSKSTQNASKTDVPQNGAPQNQGTKNAVTPDLSGEISEVNSNQVTLKLIGMPSPNNGNGQNNQNNNNQQGQLNQQNQQNRKDPNQWVQNRRDPNQNNQQGGQDPNQLGNGQARQRPIKYTGETTTITIPEDVTITVTPGPGSQPIGLQLSDLKIGDIMQVWYSDKNSKTINKISVRQVNKQNQQGNQSAK